jgi:hypothetical protein
MDRGRFVQWVAAALVVACGLAACVAETPTSEEIRRSKSAVRWPVGIPRAARAAMVIADSPNVFSHLGSLVNPHQSSAEPNGATGIVGNKT